MGMRKKTVRFYNPVILDQNDQQVEIPQHYWSKVIEAALKKGTQDRILPRTGDTGDYYGRVSHPDRGAPYLRIGRLRDRSEFPDTIDVSDLNDDELEALQLDDSQLLFESAYVVPFGLGNRVAVMGPIRGLVHSSSIAQWITFATGLENTDYRLELHPEYDKKALQKLDQAEGVSRLTIRFPAGNLLDDPTAGGDGAVTGDAYSAIAEASDLRPLETDLTITMSTAHRFPEGTALNLRETVKKLLGKGADKIEATMKFRQADGGLRTELHDLIRDDIAVNVEFEVEEGSPLEEASVLAAIAGAVRQFNERVG